MTKADIKLMDQIVDTACIAEAWDDRIREDIYIQEMEQKFYAILDGLGLSFDDRDNLEMANMAVAGAYKNAAFLYGLHVASVIQAVSRCPAELSRMILDKIEGRAQQ